MWILTPRNLEIHATPIYAHRPSLVLLRRRRLWRVLRRDRKGAARFAGAYHLREGMTYVGAWPLRANSLCSSSRAGAAPVSLRHAA